MNQDEEHLRLLSVFLYVCAGFAALFACFPFIYVIMGIAMMVSLHNVTPGRNEPPAFFGLFFILIGAAMILFGWAFAACIAYAGRCLAQRKRHTFCLVMAAIACMFVPFGTILGVFSIIVLVRPSVKAIFDGITPPVFAK
jgi:hypothetical protein